LNADELKRTGTAWEKPYTVRSIAYILAGHEQHHLGVIRAKYLST
jgi:hypothetical protein